VTSAPTAHRIAHCAIDTGDGVLSGLLAEPVGEARAAVVALHGGGMCARYFDGGTRPEGSLLRLGAGLGYTMLALDRPGYGRSAADRPDGVSLAEQTAKVGAALAAFARSHDTGDGVLLVGHSYGGKLALSLAAAHDRSQHLIGVDVSGVGHRYATAGQLLTTDTTVLSNLHWGPLRLYPPGTFRLAREFAAPMPQREAAEIPRWPDRFRSIAEAVNVPVRFTFAEHEHWWQRDQAASATLTRAFTATVATVDGQPHAGHNISLGWAARSYHLRVFGFLESCLSGRAYRSPGVSPGTSS
jgi:pimeloyl-ACP methyl ester carboxylesterase